MDDNNVSPFVFNPPTILAKSSVLQPPLLITVSVPKMEYSKRFDAPPSMSNEVTEGLKYDSAKNTFRDAYATAQGLPALGRSSSHEVDIHLNFFIGQSVDPFTGRQPRPSIIIHAPIQNVIPKIFPPQNGRINGDGAF